MLQVRSFKLDTHPSSLCYITVVADETAKRGTVYQRITFYSYKTKVIDLVLESKDSIPAITFTGKYSRSTSRQVSWFVHELDSEVDTTVLNELVQLAGEFTIAIGHDNVQAYKDFAEHYWKHGLRLNPDTYFKRVDEAIARHMY